MERLFNLKTDVKDIFIIDNHQKIFVEGTPGVKLFFFSCKRSGLCLCANGDELVSQSGTKTPILGGQTQLMALGRESFVCVCVCVCVLTSLSSCSSVTVVCCYRPVL